MLDIPVVGRYPDPKFPGYQVDLVFLGKKVLVLFMVSILSRSLGLFYSLGLFTVLVMDLIFSLGLVSLLDLKKNRKKGKREGKKTAKKLC